MNKCFFCTNPHVRGITSHDFRPLIMHIKNNLIDSFGSGVRLTTLEEEVQRCKDACGYGRATRITIRHVKNNMLDSFGSGVRLTTLEEEVI